MSALSPLEWAVRHVVQINRFSGHGASHIFLKRAIEAAKISQDGVKGKRENHLSFVLNGYTVSWYVVILLLILIRAAWNLEFPSHEKLQHFSIFLSQNVKILHGTIKFGTNKIWHGTIKKIIWKCWNVLFWHFPSKWNIWTSPNWKVSFGLLNWPKMLCSKSVQY